jgi:hypothetical protein
MKVDGIFTSPKIGTIITVVNPTDDNVSLRIGEVLSNGSKQWKVKAVERWHMGCFTYSPIQRHNLKLEPIDHSDMPAEGDELVKQ